MFSISIPLLLSTIHSLQPSLSLPLYLAHSISLSLSLTPSLTLSLSLRYISNTSPTCHGHRALRLRRSVERHLWNISLQRTYCRTDKIEIFRWIINGLIIFSYPKIFWYLWHFSFCILIDLEPHPSIILLNFIFHPLNNFSLLFFTIFRRMTGWLFLSPLSMPPLWSSHYHIFINKELFSVIWSLKI